jgi:hypothetical protein
MPATQNDQRRQMAQMSKYLEQAQLKIQNME